MLIRTTPCYTNYDNQFVLQSLTTVSSLLLTRRDGVNIPCDRHLFEIGLKVFGQKMISLQYPMSLTLPTPVWNNLISNRGVVYLSYRSFPYNEVPPKQFVSVSILKGIL